MVDNYKILGPATIYNHKDDTITFDFKDGFFSSFKYLFNSLLNFHKIFPDKSPPNIIWRPNKKISEFDTNLYPIFFKQSINKDPIAIKDLKEGIRHTIDFSTFNYENNNKIVSQYFNLSDEVVKIKNIFTQKYSISQEETIALLYRGGDHFTCQPRTDYWYFERWLKANLLGSNLDLMSNYRIMIQTDESAALKYFKALFRRRNGFNIEEMPTIDGNTCLNKVSDLERGMTITDLQLNFLAVVSIISGCKYVLLNEGSSGMGIAVFRGNFVGVCQMLPLLHIHYQKYQDEPSGINK